MCVVHCFMSFRVLCGVCSFDVCCSLWCGVRRVLFDGCWLLFVVRCVLCVVCVCVVHCVLCVGCLLLVSVCFSSVLFVVCCMLHGVCCLLSVVCCLLRVVCRVLFVLFGMRCVCVLFDVC